MFGLISSVTRPQIWQVPCATQVAGKVSGWEQTQPQVLFVPNRSALSTKVTAGWVKNHMPGAALYFSGDGTVTMLTDGTDWYIWQEPNYVDPQ